MAFLKTANALVQNIIRKDDEWNLVVAMSLAEKGMTRVASRKVTSEYDPAKWLLTHCTIVASVDVEPGDNSEQLGKVLESGFEVNRTYPEYFVTEASQPFINNNCLVPGTPVTMADGTVKPVEEVKVNDQVLTHLGRVRRVRETFKHPATGNLNELKYRGNNQRLYITGGHPVFVYRPAETCFACGGPVVRNHRTINFLLPRYYCSSACYQKTRVSNETLLAAKTGDFIEVADLKHHWDFTTTPIPQGETSVDLTLGKARLIGLFLAEGYYVLYAASKVEKNERTGAIWAFHEDETDTLAATVVDLMKQEFGIDCQIQAKDGKAIIVTTNRSPEAVEFFSHWVLGSGSTSKTLHPDLFTAPKDIQMEILRGWFEGDGSAFDTASDFRLSGCTASQSLANQVWFMLLRLGISSRVCYSKTSGRKRLVVDDEIQVVSDASKVSHRWDVSCGAGWISEIVQDTIYEDKYLQYLEIRGTVQAVPKLRFFKDSHLQMLESVEPVEYEGFVYNFDVEEDHSYIAGGIAVHNSDGFERKLLASVYKTFIGGENYVEHIQIPELSRGKLVDAVIRDVGGSLYCDILVATDRKHTRLIQDIEFERLTTLSMGCIVAFTICTKCGNVAVDDTDLCPCIKYSKGDSFIDASGHRRRIAELCGHHSQPDSVQFIEASWVRDPAFVGAVLRNILEVDSTTHPEMARKIQVAYEVGVRRLPPEQIAKVASVIQLPKNARKLAFDFDTPDDGGDKKDNGGDAPSTPGKKDKLVDELSNELLDKAKEKARSQMFPKDAPTVPQNLEDTNQSIIHGSKDNFKVFARRFGKADLSQDNLNVIYRGLQILATDGWKGVGASNFSGPNILGLAHFVDKYGTTKPKYPITYEGYIAIAAVGGTKHFSGPTEFISACEAHLGRKLAKAEAASFVVKGKLFSLGDTH